jgi:hypothetical protein
VFNNNQKRVAIMKFIRPYGQSVTDNTHRKIVVNDNWTDEKREAIAN